MDTTYPSSNYSGWLTRFSKTRTKDYALHYFLIKELTRISAVIDSIPPDFHSVEVRDSVSLQLISNENLDSLSSVALDHYTLEPAYGSPKSVTVSDSVVIMSLAKPLT